MGNSNKEKTLDRRTQRFDAAVLMALPYMASEIADGWMGNLPSLKRVLRTALVPPPPPPFRLELDFRFVPFENKKQRVVDDLRARKIDFRDLETRNFIQEMKMDSSPFGRLVRVYSVAPRDLGVADGDWEKFKELVWKSGLVRLTGDMAIDALGKLEFSKNQPGHFDMQLEDPETGELLPWVIRSRIYTDALGKNRAVLQAVWPKEPERVGPDSRWLFCY